MGKVNVMYVDESGNVLDKKNFKGEIGTAYESSALSIDGYTLKTTPSNASGSYTSEDITEVNLLRMYRYTARVQVQVHGRYV